MRKTKAGDHFLFGRWSANDWGWQNGEDAVLEEMQNPFVAANLGFIFE